MLLNADDQVVISIIEDSLQRAVWKLNQIITEHSLTIPVQKTKSQDEIQLEVKL